MAKQITANLILGDARVVDTALSSINSLAQLRGFNFIVGSAQQLIDGLATHSTIASAIAGALSGNSIYILAGTYNENVVVNKTLFISGQGYASFINGTLDYNATGDYCRVRDVRVNGNITFQAGSQSSYFDGYQTTASTVTDSGTGNYFFVQDT